MIVGRRSFSAGISAFLAGCALDAKDGEAPKETTAPLGAPDVDADADEGNDAADGSSGPLQIGMLLYPNFTAQDFVGPQLIFAGLGDVKLHVLWKDTKVVVSDSGLGIQATTPLHACPKRLDILFIPGGHGTADAMLDRELVAFVAHRGRRARYVTSVCTGSLLLGAAGLLCGYRAATHWAYRDILPILGATPVSERVVRDRNRITGGGVTAGIDFALTISAQLRGDDYAKLQELMFEYAPEPPFDTGTPEAAGPELTSRARTLAAPGVERTRRAALAHAPHCRT
ncbi:DJ-1/PfpI family protein [Pendulispora albinea]|uniref:DJ-1/PfpI family protein n=1 Tax=Pendulispora albinea TaxID=2741071 RepID=A0ABZ2M4T8_9BACT